MANPLVVNLNLRSTITNQDFKCLECGKLININNVDEKVYFRMDQTVTPGIYEVYCESCGNIKAEEDKKAGKEVEEK